MSRYTPLEIETKCYASWKQQGCFRPSGKGKPYTVLMPPPNITGHLHIGHVLNNTVQDMLVRRARMKGRNTLWIPGLDHASIATEAKVVAKLAKEGKTKQDIGREAFIKEAKAWKETYGAVILEQLEKLGISCDWSRLRYTMDETHSQYVAKAFQFLTPHMQQHDTLVNWDCKAQTALSNEEVYYKTEEGMLYHVAYPLVDEEGKPMPRKRGWEHGKNCLVIATTRPETMFADRLIAINPQDKRYTHLVEEKRACCLQAPILRQLATLGAKEDVSSVLLPIVESKHVKPDFGTGCLKITPEHDKTDWEIYHEAGVKKHVAAYFSKLGRVSFFISHAFDEKGKMNDAFPDFRQMNRFEARKKTIELLEEEGYLLKKEPHTHRVGYSERTHEPAELWRSKQLFLHMDFKQEKEKLATRLLEQLEKKEIRFYPEHMTNTYRHWLENLRDWCLSRQLWWGHRIPGQDDVLDTWFSSWLWPFSTLELKLNKPLGDKENEKETFQPQESKEDIAHYPTDVLVTGPDIIFFWVARMAMAADLFGPRDEKGRSVVPFKDVYFTGIVRDKQGRKMSKSLGNSPDPLELIRLYGADSLRMGMMMCSRAGGDILFNEALCIQGRDFANKIWNVRALISSWHEEKTLAASADEKELNACIKAETAALIEKTEAHYQTYRISDIATLLYKFIKEMFANTYLELIKPSPPKKTMATQTLQTAKEVLEILLKLLHPVMPFITESLWQDLYTKKEKEVKHLMTSSYPSLKSFPTDKKRLGQLAIALRARKQQNYALPDTATLRARAEKERARLADGLAKTEAKLTNQRFLQHAEETLVAREQKKQADSKKKLELLQAFISTDSPSKHLIQEVAGLFAHD